MKTKKRGKRGGGRKVGYFAVILVIMVALVGCSKFRGPRGDTGAPGANGLPGDGDITSYKGAIGDTQNGVRVVDVPEVRGDKVALISVSIDTRGTGYYSEIGMGNTNGGYPWAQPCYEVNYVIGAINIYNCAPSWNYYVIIVVK